MEGFKKGKEFRRAAISAAYTAGPRRHFDIVPKHDHAPPADALDWVI
jgi:hypothetical protein